MNHQHPKYNPKLKLFARQLRNQSTFTEILLWRYLKGKQRMSYDFHRQKTIQEYILDFYCPKLKLAIEIDGESHTNKYLSDKQRQQYLETLGIKFIRFYDNQVEQHIDLVIDRIDNVISKQVKELGLHTPDPSNRGEIKMTNKI